MYDVVIVGAGPSGLMCASLLGKYTNKKILLLEKNDKVGKKLLMTGNGKCNLGNTYLSLNNYYSISNNSLFKNILSKNQNEYLKVLNEIGIIYKEESKRLYPYTNQAQSVCKSFERYLENLNINIKCSYNVTNVIKENNVFIINNKIKTKKLIIATGGLSYPKTGSTGFGYEVFKKFNNKITKLYPALTYLKTDFKYIKDLFGVRWDSDVKLNINNKNILEEKGQVQFTKDSLSGVCVFNISINVKKYLDNKDSVKVLVNLLPDIKKEKLISYFKEFSYYKVKDMLSGLINNKLANVISKLNKVEDKIVKDLTKNEKENIINSLYSMEFNIVDVGDYSSSQVTFGGISFDSLNNNLESINTPNLYAIGEVVDVTGICGGYNLAWAFNSALIVFNSMSK